MREVLLIAAAVVLLMLIFRGTQTAEPPAADIAPPSDEWFEANVAMSPKPVLVKFGAEWCGPCRAMEPEIEQVAGELKGQIEIVKIDVDRKPKLAQHYQISGIPRTLVFVDGQVVADETGYLPAESIERLVKPFLK